MSNKNRNRNYRGDNAEIAKFNTVLAEHEKKVQHKRLKAKSLCTHCSSPTNTALTYKDENGKVVWICKICGERVDLSRINDDRLKDAIDTVSQACNLIKIMSSGSEKDQRIVHDIVAEIQFKANAYLFNLYKGSLASSAKQKQHRRNGGSSGGNVTWGGSNTDRGFSDNSR